MISKCIQWQYQQPYITAQTSAEILPHDKPWMRDSLQLHGPQHSHIQTLKKTRRKAKLSEMIATTHTLNGWREGRRTREGSSIS